jgi:hypothetical protein
MKYKYKLICPECKKPFKAKSMSAWYCKKCLKMRNRKHSRESYRKIRKQKKEEKTCEVEI